MESSSTGSDKHDMTWLILTGFKALKEVLGMQTFLTRLDEARGSFAPDTDEYNITVLDALSQQRSRYRNTQVVGSKEVLSDDLDRLKELATQKGVILMDEEEEEELALKNENLDQMAMLEETAPQKEGTGVSSQNSVFSFQKMDEKQPDISLSNRLSLLKQARMSRDVNDQMSEKKLPKSIESSIKADETDSDQSMDFEYIIEQNEDLLQMTHMLSMCVEANLAK